MKFSQLPADGQPETGAALFARDGSIALRKRFEYRLEPFGADTGSGVAHRHIQPFVPHLCRDLNGAGLRELDRIADEIEQDLLYAVFVDFDQGNLSVDPVEQTQRAFAHEGAGDRQNKLRESMKIGRPTVQLEAFRAENSYYRI